MDQILWVYALNHTKYLKNLKIKRLKNKASLLERKDITIILGKIWFVNKPKIRDWWDK